MHVKNRWLHLWLVFCFIIGWTVYLPALSPSTVYADVPQPPAEKLGPVPQGAPPPPLPLTKKEIEQRSGLDALEAARHQGSEAVVALGETLRGRVLDLVMDEIQAAQEALARSTPPPPEGAPVSQEEEEAALQAQQAREAAERMQPQPEDDPREGGRSEDQLPRAEIAAPAQPAADRTVGDGCTYATIALAVSAANPGDRLLLEGGVTFVENVTVNKNLTLSGGFPGCASGSSARTIIQGIGSGSVLVVNAGLTATLENLEITNGVTGFEGGGIRFAWGTGTGALYLQNVHIYGNSGMWGGGLWAGSQSVVQGTDVEIYNNTATSYGGGLRLFGSQAVFTDSAIYENTAPFGGGVYGTQETSDPVLTLESYADVYDNQALTGNGYGGGVYLRQGEVTLADCSDIQFNDAIQGGGTYLITSTLTMEGSCSEISDNTATGNGGGIYARASTINLDNQAELYNNEAGYGGGGGSGGGAFLDSSEIFSDLAHITYNTATDFGGGVYAGNGSTLDMDLGSYPCNSPHCSRLAGNTTSLFYGGGVFAALLSEVGLRQVFVESNSASLGGGVYASQSTIHLYNSLLAGNDATSGSADGVRLFNGANLFGQHNTLAYNDAGGTATGNAIAISSSSLSMSNSIVWGHAISIDLTGQSVTYSDIQGGYAGTGNLNVAPLFVAPAAFNFHLSSLSPVIDRCSTGQERDFDNELRPIYYDRPATPYDMGADEISGRVGINGVACEYGHLQDAVDAAPVGASLQIASVVLTETVNISGKNLTIAGGYSEDCTTYITGTTTIDGGGGGSVFDITGSVVTLRNLNVTGGITDVGGGVHILPGASRVTLENTDVFNNQASHGGGIYLDVGNVITITNDTDIHHNSALLNGGGARVWGKLVGNDWASAISDNTAADGGGVSLPGGTLVFIGSHINNNQAIAAAGVGGGIHVENNGAITVTHSSNISYNSAYNGAGIYANNARVHLAAVVHSNTATNNGGGAYLANGSSLSTDNSFIGFDGSGWGGNSAYLGGGLYIDSSTLDFDGYIVHNTASSQGGGIFATASTLDLVNAQVGGGDANQANQLSADGHEGAGLYLTTATRASLDNTIISSNAFQTTGYTYGGGAFVTDGSVVTMTHSIVEHNQAPSLSEGRGAGLYIEDSTVTLDDTQVLSNTAGTVGGAIYLDTSAFSANNCLFNNNQAKLHGGAIAAYDSALTILATYPPSAHAAEGEAGSELLDPQRTLATPCDPLTEQCSSFNGNQADSDSNASGSGGAIYSSNSELNVSYTYLHGNRAAAGGAIFQEGESALAQVSNTLIYSNTVVTVNGAGISKDSGIFTVTHTTIANNLGGAGFSGTASEVKNSIAWGNAFAGFDAAPSIASCNIDQSGNAGATINPLFVAPGAGEDYHLLVASPAVDACATGLSPDLDNVPRPSGSAYDIGAFESISLRIYLPVIVRQ